MIPCKGGEGPLTGPALFIFCEGVCIFQATCRLPRSARDHRIAAGGLLVQLATESEAQHISASFQSVGASFGALTTYLRCVLRRGFFHDVLRDARYRRSPWARRRSRRAPPTTTFVGRHQWARARISAAWACSEVASGAARRRLRGRRRRGGRVPPTVEALKIAARQIALGGRQVHFGVHLRLDRLPIRALLDAGVLGWPRRAAAAVARDWPKIGPLYGFYSYPTRRHFTDNAPPQTTTPGPNQPTTVKGAQGLSFAQTSSQIGSAKRKL